MIKLVDYFVVVGYDDDNDDNDDEDDEKTVGSGGDENDQESDDVLKHASRKSKKNKGKGHSLGKAKILQRFPLPQQKQRRLTSTNSTNTNNANVAQLASLSLGEDSHACDDVYSPNYNNNNNMNYNAIDEQQEFDSNIHCFCQPHKGWRLYTKQEPPTFFVSVLTDIKGQRRYCACLTFLEPYKPKVKKRSTCSRGKSKQVSGENEEDDDSTNEPYIESTTDYNGGHFQNQQQSWVKQMNLFELLGEFRIYKVPPAINVSGMEFLGFFLLLLMRGLRISK